ncbi:unnamed protein product [Caenorhabditis nigoni]
MAGKGKNAFVHNTAIQFAAELPALNRFANHSKDLAQHFLTWIPTFLSTQHLQNSSNLPTQNLQSSKKIRQYIASENQYVWTFDRIAINVGKDRTLEYRIDPDRDASGPFKNLGHFSTIHMLA